MRRCKVCGKFIKLRASKRYEVTVYPVGLECLVKKPTILECFDCPKCGCQNMVNIKEGEKDEEVSE